MLTRSEVAAKLEADVVSGELADGREAAVRARAARCASGVSRPLVREALRSLVERGLVEVSPGRGAFVRAASTAEAVRPLGSHYLRQKITPRHLLEVRMIIEPAAARLAAERASDAEIAALGHVVEQIEAAASVLERARWDITLHALVARMSRNPVIETTFESIAALVFELMLRSLSDPNLAGRVGAVPRRRSTRRSATATRTARTRRCSPTTRAARSSTGKDIDESLDLVARRELERLVGPTASLEQIISDVVQHLATATPDA